jgi:hypothetical protein
VRSIERSCLLIVVAGLAACQAAPETRRTAAPDDGLDPSAAAYVGKLLEVRPFHGYGWNESHLVDGSYTHQDITPPPLFKVRLKRLWSYEGTVRRGGVGQVESPGHPLDGMWLLFSTRHVGHFDFTERIADYNVAVMSAEPTDTINGGWPTVPKSAPAKTGYDGYAQIGVRLPDR